MTSITGHSIFVILSVLLIGLIVCSITVRKDFNVSLFTGNLRKNGVFPEIEEISLIHEGGRKLKSILDAYDSMSSRGRSHEVDAQDSSSGYFTFNFFTDGSCLGKTAFVEAYLTGICLPVGPEQSDGLWLSMKYSCVSGGNYALNEYSLLIHQSLSINLN